MYIKKNDFIILGRTECYFVDWTNKTIGVGTIVAYNNIERIVTIQYKVRHPNEYVTLYLENSITKDMLDISFDGVKFISRKMKKGEYLGKITISYNDKSIYIIDVYL